MILKMITFPFWLLSTVIKFVFRLLTAVFSMGFGTVRLVINRLFSTVFGALIGFFLGKRHIGIKLFTGKKRNSRPQ